MKYHDINIGELVTVSNSELCKLYGLGVIKSACVSSILVEFFDRIAGKSHIGLYKLENVNYPSCPPTKAEEQVAPVN